MILFLPFLSFRYVFFSLYFFPRKERRGGFHRLSSIELLFSPFFSSLLFLESKSCSYFNFFLFFEFYCLQEGFKIPLQATREDLCISRFKHNFSSTLSFSYLFRLCFFGLVFVVFRFFSFFFFQII